MATFDNHANFGYSTVAVAPVPALSGTTLTVADASDFPAAPFNCTVCPPNVRPTAANAEIVRVTLVVGNVFTIVRTQEGSSAKAIAVGWQIANTISVKVITDLETAVNSPFNISAGTTSNQLAAVTFANSNGVSFGLDGSTITASVVPPSGAVITVSAGTTDGALSQIVFSDSNNVSFGLNGSTVTAIATVASSLSNIRISAGTTSNLLSAVTFANGNGVSFGLNASTITATVKTDYLTTAMASNRGSDFVQATAAFAGTNASGTIASDGISVSVDATVAQTNQTVGLYASSNTTLTSSGTVDARSMTFRAIGSLTVGVSASEVLLSAPNALTSQSNQNVTAGNGGFAFQTLSFSDANNVSFSTSAGSAIVASATVASTQGSIRISAGTTSVLSSAFTFSDSNGLAFGIDNGTVTGSYTVPTVTNSSWTASDSATSLTISRLAFTNSNGVTMTLSTAAGAATVIASHNGITTQTNQTLGLYASSNTTLTSSGTADARSLSIRAIGSLTVGVSASELILSAPNALTVQTNQTLGLYMSSNTTSSVSSGTVDARSMTFRGAGVASVGYSGGEVVISVPAGGGGITNINISAGTTSNDLSKFTLADSNGVSFGLNGSTVTATVSTYSTVGTATTVYPVASANSVGTVTRWAAEDHRHAGIGGLGISTAGNSAGTSGSEVGTYWLQGGNAITISQITSNNGSHTAILSGSAPVTASYFTNVNFGGAMVTGASAITQTSGSSIFVQPFLLPFHISIGWLRLLASWNDSAVGTGGTPVVNSSFSVERYTTFGYVVFSQGAGASSRSLQMVTSSSEGMTGRTSVGAGAQSSRYTITIQKSYPVSGTTSSYTSSYAVSSASIVISSDSNTLFTGPRFLDLRFGVSLNPGNYWLGLGMSTNTATQSANISFATSAGLAISIAGVSESNVSVGVIGAATSASDHQMFRGQGVWSTNASRYTTDSIGVNSISQVVSNPQMPFQFIREV